MNSNVLIYLLCCLFIIVCSWEEEQLFAEASLFNEFKKEDAIRLRIVAHSDTLMDQALKTYIRDRVNVVMTALVVDVTSPDEAAAVIERNMAVIEQVIENELQQLQLSHPFHLSFQKETFPTRVYGNIVYPAGEYDAVVITIGDGEGENWWCVLFPPLCFLEMDTNEKKKEAEEEEVSFFILDWLADLRTR